MHDEVSLVSFLWTTCLLIFISCYGFAQETVFLSGEDDWAPYSSASSDYKDLTGLSPQIVKAAYQSQGVNVVLRPVPFARCIYEVEQGKALGCFNAIISSETRGKYVFHELPLFEAQMVVFGRINEKKSKISLKDLENKTVGTTNGYTYPTEFIENKKIRHSQSPTEKSQLEKLASGRIDYAILWGMTGAHLLKDNPELAKKVKPVGLLSKDGLYISFSKKRKDSVKYARVLDQGLRHIKKNGTYDKIMKDFYQDQPKFSYLKN